jgi:hypothetical protein
MLTPGTLATIKHDLEKGIYPGGLVCVIDMLRYAGKTVRIAQASKIAGHNIYRLFTEQGTPMPWSWSEEMLTTKVSCDFDEE